MKRSTILLALVLLASGPGSGGATTIVGDLNNFDTLNDTGQVCYGFEIEIDDVVSTDITYTFDWNHYGAPTIRQDNTNPAHPKVFIRYESTERCKWQLGRQRQLHQHGNPHDHATRGPYMYRHVGQRGLRALRGRLLRHAVGHQVQLADRRRRGHPRVLGLPVPVAAPTFVYTPPAGAQPAQVVAAIPAPVVPNQVRVGKEFGEPSWVKVIKTTSHNANRVALQDLISGR
jgi:hypothetical protein